MTFNALTHAALADHAADSQRDSDRDLGLSLILTRLQGGKCFDCGQSAELEFAHFTRAKGRTSRAMGVIGAMACRPCNLVHDRICDALGTEGTLPLAYLTRPGVAERIVTDYPTRGECVREAKAHRAATGESVIMAEASRRMAECGL